MSIIEKTRRSPFVLLAHEMGAAGGRVTLRLSLNGSPDVPWITYFHRYPGARSGSPAYAFGYQPPIFEKDGTIIWTVPTPDSADALRYLRESIEFANTRYLDIAG